MRGGSKSFERVLVGVVLINLAITVFLIWRLTILAPETSLPFVSPGASDEVRVLQGELDAINRYHGDVITTVWGALAAIAAVVVVGAILGTLQTNRNYDRDKQALEEDVARRIEDVKKELVEALTAEEARIESFTEDRIGLALRQPVAGFTQSITYLENKNKELTQKLTMLQNKNAEDLAKQLAALPEVVQKSELGMLEFLSRIEYVQSKQGEATKDWGRAWDHNIVRMYIAVERARLGDVGAIAEASATLRLIVGVPEIAALPDDRRNIEIRMALGYLERYQDVRVASAAVREEWYKFLEAERTRTTQLNGVG